jgi:N-acetylmuramoyl-L-alanine amidase
MAIKTTLNYSPNFNTKKRSIKQIKFIIFHYTGMKKESEAINRLTNIQSEVSCHYLIKNNGEIIKMVPES